MNLPAPRADSHLARLRLAELTLLRPFIRQGARVLEVGGGNGFQAAVLASWGCEVTSIDLEETASWSRQYFPVMTYDGVYLPFEDNCFDIVFSSNVLEHVKRLPDLLLETARVLRTGGNAIHVVPTPIWRFWTILTHYPYLLKRIAVGSADDVGVRLEPAGNIVRRLSLAELAWRAAVPRPHGEFRSSIEELFQYRGDIWQRRFAAAGLQVDLSFRTGIFYTGNAIFPRLSLQARRAIGRVLGSACHVFILARQRSTTIASTEIS